MLAKYKIIQLIINKYIIINIATTMVRTQNIVSKHCRVSKLPMCRGKVGQHHGPSFISKNKGRQEQSRLIVDEAIKRYRNKNI